MAEKQHWLKSAVADIAFFCFPLAVFSFLSFDHADFALMFTYFVLLLFLFVAYIVLKNYRFYHQTKPESHVQQEEQLKFAAVNSDDHRLKRADKF